MILDSFKIAQLIVQIRYPLALELWDNAGSANRRIQKIWPGTKVVGEQVSPNQVILKNDTVQIDTGLSQSTVALNRPSTIEQSSRQIVDTFAAWRNELSLTELTRVSSRVLYTQEFPTLLAANRALFALGLCRYPTEKVFGQSPDSPNNSLDLTYRFEDETSFALLRVRTEQIRVEFKINAELTTLQDTSETKNRFIIDFDRGLKSSIEAASFLMDEWIKGFAHILRRDVEKVLKE